MDCNKEEATRAKELAENKMHGRDFVGAKKLLLKALQLLPDIENASHMLNVCEVHCSAGSLVNGQTDYYGVLKVEASADEALIRKQYRKLALLLHPDKNKFAGAESAFKLVGEAYKVLSDQANRQVYDSKRRVQIRTVSSWQSSQNSRNARRYPAATINVSNSQFSGLKQQEQQPPFVSSQCFWTMCVFCNNRFQYARSWLGIEVQCQKCFRKFFAFEVSVQNIPQPGSSSGFNWSRTGLHETSVPVHPSYNHASQTVPVAKHEYKPGNQERSRSGVDGMAGNQEKSENAKPESKPLAKPSYGTAGRARNRKVVVNTSDSSSSSSGSDSIDSMSEVEPTVLDDGPTSSRYPRRSTRSKINVTYKEDESEDDGFANHPKRIRKVGSVSRKNRDVSSPVATNGVKIETGETSIFEDGINGEQTEDYPCKDNLPRPSVQEQGTMPEFKETVSKKAEKQVRASSNTTSAARSRSQKPKAVVSFFTYPDTQFFDFNKERNKIRFAKDQVWAVYDEDEGMPRYYALIKKSFRSNLYYIWLENNPTSAAEKAWVAAQLPIACGNFTLGNLCSTETDQMFSHLVFSNNIRKEIYSLYPKKGEVWALFKDWDIGWSSAVDRPRKYEYEIAQVVSDFAYGQDIIVCHLVKVEGFRYVFAPNHEGNTVIPSGQLLKFSHCIPYYSLDEEREGIPRDSFELDPAALPETFLKISDAVNADTVEVSDAKFVDPVNAKDKHAGSAVNNKRPRHGPNDNSDDIFNNSDEAREERPVDSEVPCYTNRRTVETTGYDEDDEDSSFNGEASTISEFYNFHELRSEEKFEKGQIWALYSDINEYPNYYAWIKGEWEESGFISIKWLEHPIVTQEAKLLSKNGLPFGCGKFRVVEGICRFNTTDMFSHMVHAKAIRKNDWYEIYPNKGEVWALYKNWSLLSTSTDIGNIADYFVVEIIERNESLIKAVSLIKVKGYSNVFKPETRGVADLEIPIKECFRFSHLIPAFQLTDEESGKLKDCWELDPDSVPKVILAMDS